MNASKTKFVYKLFYSKKIHLVWGALTIDRSKLTIDQGSMMGWWS